MRVALQRSRQRDDNHIEVDMKKRIVTQDIQKMVRRLVDRFDPDQIILFGSHARGTARPDSDIDLLVILPVTGSKREKQIEMRVALHDINVPKDIIVATPEQVEQQKNIVGTMIRPALKEGQVLYERTRQTATFISAQQRPAMKSPVYKATPRERG
jgi:predicted nucleotidyltransferase